MIAWIDNAAARTWEHARKGLRLRRRPAAKMPGRDALSVTLGTAPPETSDDDWYDVVRFLLDRDRPA